MSAPPPDLHALFNLPEQPVELPAGVPAEYTLPVFQAALLASPLPTVITDADLDPPGPRITFANRAFCAMTGYPPAELVGQTPRLFQGPNTDRRVLDELKAALRAGEPFRGRTVNYAKGGDEYPVCWTIVPMRHAGRVVRFVSYQHRLAAGDGAEADPFELVFRAATLPVSVVDEAGRFVRVNPAFCRLTGYAEDDLVGRGYELVAPPDDVAASHARHAAHLAGMPAGTAERVLVRRDGGRRTVYRSVGLLTSPAGRRFVVSTHIDVTAQREAEEQLRTAERRFELAVRRCGLAFWEYDVAAGRAHYSAGWKDMLGYADHEIGDSLAECTDRRHPDDRERVRPTWEALLAGTATEYDLEFRMRHKDGSYRWVQSLAAVEPGPDGRPVRIAGTHTDRTAQKEFEAEFRQAQKMEAVGQLAGGIAHDFNNLLTVILGNLDLMTLPADDPNRPLLAAVRAAAGGASELTAQLLGFARRLPVRFGAVDAGRLLADTASLLRRLLDPRIELTVRAADGLVAQGDTGLLRQAVLNLCVNARDAMPTGGELTLSADAVALSAADVAGVPDARPGRWVRIRVADTGSGMSAEVRARVFEPFFTTKPAGRGTGLGLAMVSGTVRQHGGWVGVESAEGEGTVVDVYLPPAAPPAAGAKRALVIDDEDTVRTLARMVLERAGWEVSEAASAEAGLAAIAAGVPAVVVLDLTMPGLSGAEAVRAVRAAAPAARLVVASGYDPPDELGEVSAVFLPKPYRPDELVKAVGT